MMNSHEVQKQTKPTYGEKRGKLIASESGN